MHMQYMHVVSVLYMYACVCMNACAPVWRVCVHIYTCVYVWVTVCVHVLKRVIFQQIGNRSGALD